MIIPPFWAGVLCTAFCELLALFLILSISIIRSMRNSSENTSNNARSDKNE